MAHKKGQGSSHNGRESESKRLGVKRADGQLYALVDGNVKFERKGKDKKQVSVYPVEAVEKAKKEVAAKA